MISMNPSFFYISCFVYQRHVNSLAMGGVAQMWIMEHTNMFHILVINMVGIPVKM